MITDARTTMQKNDYRSFRRKERKTPTDFLLRSVFFRVNTLHLKSVSAFYSAAAAVLLVVDNSTLAGAEAQRGGSRGNVYDRSADGSKQVAEALASAEEGNRHVLLQFGGDWCIPCIRLHRLFETNKTIRETLQANYVVEYIEYNERNEHLAAKYRATELGLPFIVILAGSGERLTTKGTEEFEDSGQHRLERVLAFLKEWTPTALAAKPLALWVQELIEKPQHADTSVEFDQIRKKAAEAVPCLIAAVKTRPTGMSAEVYPAARIRAYETLAPIAPTSAAFLGEQFLSDEQVRDVLRAILIKLGPDAKDAIPALRRGFHSSDLDLQFRAAWALAHLDPSNSELVPTIISWLKSSNVLARRGAPTVLRDLGPAAKSALPALIEATADGDETVRRQATKAIAKIGAEK
jgi:thioredoxin-related protein